MLQRSQEQTSILRQQDLHKYTYFCSSLYCVLFWISPSNCWVSGSSMLAITRRIRMLFRTHVIGWINHMTGWPQPATSLEIVTRFWLFGNVFWWVVSCCLVMDSIWNIYYKIVWYLAFGNPRLLIYVDFS